MRITRLYTLAGLVWGLLLGAAVGWLVIAVAAGVSWLYLFGDNPWPEAVGWVLPLLGLGAGLGAFALCTAAGRAMGRRAERAGSAAAARRTGQILLAAGLGLVALAAVLLAARAVEQAGTRERLAEQEARFQDLRAGRHSIESVALAPADDRRSLDLRVETRGTRAGAYRLAWAVRSPAYGATLASGEAKLVLKSGAGLARVAIDTEEIMRAYHGVALDAGEVDVEVAESFRLELALRPELSAAERDRLPPRETANLARGLSALIDRRSLDFPAAFRIRGREYEWLK